MSTTLTQTQEATFRGRCVVCDTTVAHSYTDAGEWDGVTATIARCPRCTTYTHRQEIVLRRTRGTMR